MMVKPPKQIKLFIPVKAFDNDIDLLALLGKFETFYNNSKYIKTAKRLHM